MKKMLLPVCAVLVAVCCRADEAVWDPAEYARLAQQAGQISAVISTTRQLAQLFSSLSAGLGSSGGRGLPSSSVTQSLGGMASVSPGDAGAALPTVTGGQSASQSSQSHAAVRQAERQAAADGYALALLVNQDVAGAGNRAQQLAAQAAAAGDVRADLQANSAVCLAILAELNAIDAVLALRLQQGALRHLAAAVPGGG